MLLYGNDLYLFGFIEVVLLYRGIYIFGIGCLIFVNNNKKVWIFFFYLFGVREEDVVFLFLG